MKKLFVIGMMILGVTAFVSCKKECSCTTTQSGPGMEPMVTTTTMTIKSGKCSDMNITQDMNVGAETMTQKIECVEA